jgi:hypothetical protein
MADDRYTDKNFSKDQQFGAEMEQHAASWLEEKLGFKTEAPGAFTARFDLTVINPKNGSLAIVEVKAANQKSHKGCLRWQFDNTRGTKEQDIVLLLAVADDEIHIYVVPKEDLHNRPGTIEITSHPKKYNGWLAKYRNAVENLLVRMI